MDDKLLGIYLNDHMAGSVAGVELAKRARDNNEGTALGDFLESLVDEIERDRDSLAALMEHHGVSHDPLKKGVAWAAEKLGRAKPNGQLTGYSPLSRLIELEGLTLGVTGKLALWRALAAAQVSTPADVDLDELARRAERQQDQLEERRMEAARTAFAGLPAGA